MHFSETCAMLLTKYLATHSKDIPVLFSSPEGNRLSSQAVEQMVSKLGQAAGLPRHLTPHIFRHTFATNLLSKGADLNFISLLLGHEDLATTRIYAHILPETLTSLYRRYMG